MITFPELAAMKQNPAELFAKLKATYDSMDHVAREAHTNSVIVKINTAKPEDKLTAVSSADLQLAIYHQRMMFSPLTNVKIAERKATKAAKLIPNMLGDLLD